MRHWLFKPFIFYPLLLIASAFIVLASLNPLGWPRPEHAVSGAMADGALVLQGDDLGAPAPSPEQRLYVVRDLWGHAEGLRVGVLPDQPAPTAAETGVRIMLSPEAAAFVEDKPVRVDIDYRPIPVNMATGLAVSLQGIGPADWISQPISPETGSVSFELPPQFAVDAIGLRALHEEEADSNFGLEIVRIRVTPTSG